jgi:WD40 repeat protein
MPPIKLPWTAKKFAFFPDGQKLAILDEMRLAVINGSNGAIIGTLTNNGYVSALACHPDGRRVALGHDSGEIVLWDAEDGNRQAWTGESEYVAHLAFDPAGEMLISAHWNNISQLWSVASAQRITTQRGLMLQRFAPDGTRIAGVVVGGFGVWHIQRPEHLRTLAFPPGCPAPFSVAFSPDTRWLVSVHPDGLRLWDIARVREVAVRRAHGAGKVVSFAADGKSILTTQENRFWQWPISQSRDGGAPEIGAPQAISDTGLLPIQAAGDRGFARLFPADVKWHFSSSKVRFADLTKPTQLYELTPFGGGTFSLSRTTNWLAYANARERAVDKLSGATLALLPSETPSGVVLLSPDNRSLTHFGSGRVTMFSPETGERRWTRPQEIPATIFPCFAHDSRVVAFAGSSSPQVWLFDSVSGEELAVLTRHGNIRVTQFAISADDTTFAVVHGSHILLWNLPTLRRQLAGLGLDW